MKDIQAIKPCQTHLPTQSSEGNIADQSKINNLAVSRNSLLYEVHTNGLDE